MRFSIIIPVYNSESSIIDALKSVQNQTYTDYEAIIIDDGSTDRTASICKEFTLYDNRFTYIFQTNKGASSARNAGISLATGEYIVFLDSDDTYTIDYLSEFNALIESYTQYDNYWCGFDVDSKIHQNPISKSTNMLSDRVQIMEMHIKMYDNILWNKAFKRDVLISNNITMPEDLSLGEDLIFNLRYLDCTNGKIVINPTPLYHYSTTNENSLDRKYREDLLDVFKTIDEALLKYLHKWNVDEKQLKLYYNSVFFHYEKVLYNTYRPESKLSKREKITFNSSIIKSKQFQSALQLSDCYINPLYKIAYKLRSWTMIRYLDKLINIKNKFN